MLHVWEAVVWGVFGGVVVDGIELVKVIRAYRGRLPPDVRRWAYWIAELLRLVIGGGLAVALNDAGQISGAFGALAVGAAAPLIAEKLSQTIPLPLPGQNAVSTGESETSEVSEKSEDQ